MKINLLTADVYNRIAAGEVVDRPYSVVKELVENAIDAGATEITIEADQGGKKRVRVSDNGCGIGKEDLKSAFLPHATSKLKTVDDLERIVTLGFRGEAVASIAAVSETSIVSKTADGEGYSIVCNGGKIGEPVREGCADGTCVTVDNLFFNTPARLKFLKSDAQEEGDVSNMVSRFILSRPEIAFTYVVNGKIKYRSFGDGLRSALAVVYGAGILGDCYEIDAEKHGVRLRGFIGNQNFSKPNRSWQSLFVNGRYVVNQTVSAAISNAYGSYLMKRQYPFYTLFLDVPPEIVDVNVHPNKADVRFADNQIIYGSVYSVISAVLDGNSRALEYLAEKPAPATGADGAATREQPSVVERSLNLSERAVPQMTFEEAKNELRFELPTKETKQELRFELPSTDSSAAEEERFPLNVLEVRAPKAEEDYFAENKRFLEEREKKRKQEKIDPARLTYKGELFQTYLIYEEGDTAYLVDQHAAHERTIYDRLREKYLNRSVLSQPMLAPYLLNVNAQEFAFLSERLDALRDLGFEIEEFGGNSFKVSALPVDLRNMSLDEFFNEVLRQTESIKSIRLVDILKDKLATAACKAAVKGGEKLTEEEVKELLKKMDGDMGLKCPHGRPVAVKLTKTEVEKLFKRIV